MNYVGIDISKQDFDVAIEEGDSYRHYKLKNDLGGFKEMVKLLSKDEYWCVMEATGPYYLKLASYLSEKGITLSVINPLVIRRFCQMRLTKAKTDKKDAKMIAAYGRTEKPKAWKAEAPYVIKLRQMQAYISQLDKSRTGYIRQMEAFNQSPIMSKEVKKGIEKMIACTESQIAALERSMEEIVSEHHQTMYEQIKSVPGIGR